MKKKSWMISIVVAGLLCVPSASALIANGAIAPEFTMSGNSSIGVTVASSVSDLGSGVYEYTYQVRGIGDLNVVSLSVPFSPPIASSDVYDFDPLSGGDAATYYWNTIGDPALSAFALFNPQLLQEGITTEYKFKSIYGAEEVRGYVDDAQLGSLYGTLLAPVPEPVTISLFAIGAGIIIRKRQKKGCFNTKDRRVV